MYLTHLVDEAFSRHTHKPKTLREASKKARTAKQHLCICKLISAMQTSLNCTDETKVFALSLWKKHHKLYIMKIAKGK